MCATFEANPLLSGLLPATAAGRKGTALPEMLHRNPHSRFCTTTYHGNRGFAMHGFTMMELLLVLFLLSVVAVIGISALDGVEEDAAYQATQAEMAEVAKALRQFRRDNGEFPCRAYRADGNFVLDEVDMTLLEDLPSSPATPAQRRNWCEGEATLDPDTGAVTRDNALSMLLKFPFDDADAAYSGLLWNKDSRRGWRGPYMTSNGILQDGWGNSYRLIDAELDYPIGHYCKVVAQQYECLPSSDPGFDSLEYPLPANTVRIVSAGSNGIYGGVNAADPCLPNDEDDLVLCLLR